MMSSGINVRTIRSNSVFERKPAPAHATESKFWNFLNNDISFGSSISDKVREQFYLELSSLLEAGIDIRTSLELIIDNLAKKAQKVVFKGVLLNIVNGDTFSVALSKVGKFSTYEYFSVQIGEETGRLTQVLGELGEYFKKKIKQRRQIIGAITYPAIVLVVAFAAISFMIAFVVPMFSDVFKRFGGDLPMPTKVVVKLSAIVKGYLGWTILVVLTSVGFLYFQRKKTTTRKWFSAILLRLPIVRTLICKIYISRFANTMALLISAKVPILLCIQMSRKMIGFYPIEYSLFSVEEDILAGVPLYKSLSRFNFYPKKMVAMLKVGEDINQLDNFFKKISEQYADDVEYQTTLLSKFIEPLIIVVLGLVVGLILIAMYLPLFKLGQAI
jgi:type IV pilus assembly protein PilC